MALQSKLFAFLAVFAVLLALEWILFVDHERTLLKDEYVERADILARTLAELSREPLASSQISRLEALLQSITLEKDVAYARIADARFRILADTRGGEAGWTHSGRIVEGPETEFAQGLLISRAPIRILTEPAGMAEIAFSLDSMQGKISRNRIIFIEIFAFQLLAGALLSALLIRQIVNPLRAFSRAVTSISPRDEESGIRVPRSSSVEIVAVIAAVNGMRERLAGVRKQMIREAKFATMGKIAANMAHEIRNPLEAISGAVELIEAESADTTHGRYLSIIREEIGNLNEYLGGFLEFARSEPSHTAPTDLNNLLEEVLILMRPLAKKSGMAVRNLSPRGPVICSVDRNGIKRVILNLVLNGIEAGHADGAVEVATCADNGCAVIEVRDDGCGIPASILDRVFDPYFSTKGTGTGIGLSVSKRLVEQHGGGIRIESTAGNGTVVTVTLPTGRGE
jgi:signal transduction histidine kinase